jgi:predicted TPR repeat methyltransferase
MLGQARARAIYDDLVEDELTSFLRAHPAVYDLIASADTLCYFGDITPVSAAAVQALRHGGWLAFTLERADDVEEYRINPHGRYSHAGGYVAASLDAAGLRDVRVEPAVLRFEAGQPVDGWVVRGRRP